MTPPLGLGLGWRPDLAALALERADLGFVEVIAESVPADRPLPLALDALRRRGVRVVPHGVGLSLGSAGPPEPARVAHLAALAERAGAPMVSEHIAFVRAGGLDAGHLLPVPRTRAALEVLVANVGMAMAALPVPLALEPIATLFEWPGREIDEAAFVTELLDRTGALLLLDVANVYANARNHGFDPRALLDQLPLDRLAYVHVAGGVEDGGLYHDTHAHPVPRGVLDLLDYLASGAPVPGAMLERDRRFPGPDQVEDELDAIAEVARKTAAVPRPSRCPPADRGPTAKRAELRSGGVDALADAAEALAAEQEALVAALLGTRPPPPGFDAGRLEAAAAALAEKRSRQARQARQPVTASRPAPRAARPGTCPASSAPRSGATASGTPGRPAGPPAPARSRRGWRTRR